MNRIYDLGPFRLDAKLGALTRAGMPAVLGARAIAVLTLLVDRAQQFVSKNELIDAAWRDVIVEESNLAVQIHAIRRVLAEAPGGEHWIETLAKRGYRFVGPVTALPEPGERDARRSNLPEAVTSFVGRERDLAEIKRLLPGRRLITLVGVGGIGKTRLALQLAGEVLDAYRDGVWFADFGALRDPALVPTSLAQVLGVPERVGKPLVDALCTHLRRQQVLLVLDNCEHLLPSCVRLIDGLLGRTADATILATSREPLRTDGEQVYALQPLSLPALDANVAAMASSEAVQLLVDRVRRQLPDFELTAARAPALAALCVHLDGIPLALELAAARARSLSVEQINARLGDRFRLLTGGSRSALPRQQTLRAALDWSYDLLAEDERVVLCRLAIFPGSFTVEAASAVASDTSIDEFAVIDLLSQLVARSLVIAEAGESCVRYRMLETTRAYALEKLAEVGMTNAIARRHAEHFRDLFERAPGDWLRMSGSEWRRTYIEDVDNIRSALDWAFASGGDLEIAIRLSSRAAPLWVSLGLSSEGTARLQDSLVSVDSKTPPSDHAHLWFWLSALKSQIPEQQIDGYRRAADFFRQAGDIAWLGLSLLRVGSCLLHVGRTAESAELYAEAVSPLQAARLPVLFAEYLLAIGNWKWFTGDVRGARIDLEKSAVLCREIRCARVAGGVFANLAELAWLSGDLDTALARLQEVIEIARESPKARRSDLGMFLTNLAGVHVERGELSAALSAAREGLPIRQEFGSAAWALDHLALRVALTGKIANAARIAGHADRAYARHAADRQPNEARARERLRAIFSEKMAADEVERMLGEGRRMSEEEACRIALEE